MLCEAERCCHEVRFENRRCIEMRLRPGLCPRPCCLNPTDSLAGFGVRGMEKGEWKWTGVENGTEGEGTGEEGKVEGREGRI